MRVLKSIRRKIFTRALTVAAIAAAVVILLPNEAKADTPDSSGTVSQGAKTAKESASGKDSSSTAKDQNQGTVSPYVSPDVITEDTSGKPFAIEGNGNLVDDAYDDDTKEFITIQTKNNQTFFVVIDRANSVNNVYMLSMIDEDDLEQFLSEDSEAVQIDDISDLAALEETQPDTTEQQNKPKGSGGMLYIILIIAAIGILGGYYYIRIYKPRKEEQEADSEGMEGNDEPDDYDRGEDENEDDEEENEYEDGEEDDDDSDSESFEYDD